MTLLQAVVSVALVAMVVVGGVQYASPEVQTRNRIATQAEGGFGALEGAYRARQSTGAPPPSAEGWTAALFPTYGERPADLRGLAWSYGSDEEGIWFCLSGPLNETAARTALDTLARRYPAGHYDVTSACGGKGGPPDARIAASLWMQRTGG